ncbi:MAG: hypothetical protein IPJ94_30575 [Chloroflexi bacterium]|nr:hypothetical protein [Chloroflexota bacterium]
MMKTKGSFTFAAPPTDIWPFLVNPQTLSQIIPGCQDISAQANGAYLAKLHSRRPIGRRIRRHPPADRQPTTDRLYPHLFRRQ